LIVARNHEAAAAVKGNNVGRISLVASILSRVQLACHFSGIVSNGGRLSLRIAPRSHGNEEMAFVENERRV